MTEDVITLNMTWEDIVCQISMLSCCGLTFFYVLNCQSYIESFFKKIALKDSRRFFITIIIYLVIIFVIIIVVVVIVITKYHTLLLSLLLLLLLSSPSLYCYYLIT